MKRESIRFKARIAARKRSPHGKKIYEQFYIFIPARFKEICRKLKKKGSIIDVILRLGNVSK